MNINNKKRQKLNQLITLLFSDDYQARVGKLIAELFDAEKILILPANDEKANEFVYPDDFPNIEPVKETILKLCQKSEILHIQKASATEEQAKLLALCECENVLLYRCCQNDKQNCCILLCPNSDQLPLNDNTAELLRFTTETIIKLSQIRRKNKEDKLILEKQAQLAEDEKGKIVNEYININKENEKLKRLLVSQTKELDSFKEKENELFDKIAQISKEYHLLESKFGELTSRKAEKTKKSEEQQKYIRTLSNAMRNSINALLSLKENIYYGKDLNQNRDKYIELINRLSDDLLDVSEKFFELSQKTGENTILNKHKINVNELLEKIGARFGKIAESKDIRLVIKPISDNSKQNIITDKLIFEKTIELILKYFLEIEQTKYIKLQAELRRDIIILLTENDAPYPSEKQKHKDKNNPANTDSELSFHLIKQKIELLGGTYSKGTKQTKGIYLKINIPCASIAEENTANKTSQDISPNTGKERQHGILIAEDEEINFMLLETLLTDVFQLNPVLYHAENGRQAIDIYKKERERIDLILMDLKMPIMDGFLATQEIRALQTNVPIIAQTAYNSREYKIKAAESGCNDLISKPISRNAFRDVLTKHLGLEIE